MAELLALVVLLLPARLSDGSFDLSLVLGVQGLQLHLSALTAWLGRIHPYLVSPHQPTLFVFKTNLNLSGLYDSVIQFSCCSLFTCIHNSLVYWQIGASTSSNCLLCQEGTYSSASGKTHCP